MQLFINFKSFAVSCATNSAAISMGIYAVPVVKSRINLAGDNNRQRLFIFLRTVFGYLLVYLSITALKLISLGDSITILLSAPIYTSIFARIFLKERLTLVNVLFVLMSLAGVVLVARPPFLFGSNEAYDVKKLIGAAQSMVAALSFSVSCIVMRKLKGTNPTVSQRDSNALQIFRFYFKFFYSFFSQLAGRVLVRCKLLLVHYHRFAVSKIDYQ